LGSVVCERKWNTQSWHNDDIEIPGHQYDALAADEAALRPRNPFLEWCRRFLQLNPESKSQHPKSRRPVSEIYWEISERESSRNISVSPIRYRFEMTTVMSTTKLRFACLPCQPTSSSLAALNDPYFNHPQKNLSGRDKAQPAKERELGKFNTNRGLQCQVEIPPLHSFSTVVYGFVTYLSHVLANLLHILSTNFFVAQPAARYAKQHLLRRFVGLLRQHATLSFLLRHMI
jgi:hypothetical protein